MAPILPEIRLCEKCKKHTGCSMEKSTCLCVRRVVPVLRGNIFDNTSSKLKPNTNPNLVHNLIPTLVRPALKFSGKNPAKQSCWGKLRLHCNSRALFWPIPFQLPHTLLQTPHILTALRNNQHEHYCTCAIKSCRTGCNSTVSYEEAKHNTLPPWGIRVSYSLVHPPCPWFPLPRIIIAEIVIGDSSSNSCLDPTSEDFKCQFSGDTTM